MVIFNRNKPDDVLFLQKVRFTGEKIPRGKVRMLYCDASGKVYSSIISRSVYERARDNAAIMTRRRKPFATIGLETGPGQFVPTTIEINSREAWALEHILAHALKNGRLPDILKKYLKPLVKIDESERETVISDYRKRRRTPAEPTPKVLERLPYYQEEDMEVSVPIYKAEYAYPLIVLKLLPTEAHAPRSGRRLLILDSSGDMAVITVPAPLARKMELELTERGGNKRGNTCALISRSPDGYTVSYMSISLQQRKSLDTLTRYFEATGSSKQPVSLAVKTVLTRAKDSTPSPAR